MAAWPVYLGVLPLGVVLMFNKCKCPLMSLIFSLLRLGWLLKVLCRYQHIWNIDLCFRPAFLGGIMQATGNKPPAMLPKRAEYLLKDIKRMTVSVPDPVPCFSVFSVSPLIPGTLGAMRFLTAIEMTQPQYLEPLSREFWIRFWSQHEDISQPENILAVARQAGLSSELTQKLVEMISTPAVKNRLKETTEEAIKYGVRCFQCYLVSQLCIPSLLTILGSKEQ
uniref:Glutathione S-transferase kappa 1 n=1 Tax=Strix occidentalis caurina TaxID=311401 RepID=A0A8D0EZ69_STROC